MSAETPLARHLNAPPPARPGPLDALREARRTFQAGQRIDMQTLATTLGIDRATLYRWVGSREKLLTEVLWTLMHRTLQRLGAGTDSRPSAADVVTGAAQATITNRGMQRFLECEGDLALKLLTTKATDFQQRLTDAIAEIVDADRRAGLLHSAIPDDDLAYVIVRIMESYVYLGLITGEKPDAARAASVIRALLPTGPGR